MKVVVITSLAVLKRSIMECTAAKGRYSLAIIFKENYERIGFLGNF